MQQQAVSASQGNGGALGLPLTPPFAQQPNLSSINITFLCTDRAPCVNFLSHTRDCIQLQLGHSKLHAKDSLLVGRVVAYRFLALQTETDL